MGFSPRGNSVFRTEAQRPGENELPQRLKPDMIATFMARLKGVPLQSKAAVFGLSSNCCTSMSTISLPISRDAVAAGEGTLQT